MTSGLAARSERGPAPRAVVAALVLTLAPWTCAASTAMQEYTRLFDLGARAAGEEDYATAERQFRAAVAMQEAENIEDSSAYNALGWVLFSQGELSRAEAYYLRGIALERKNSASLNRKLFTNVGYLYYSLGNLGKAERFLDIAAERYDSAAADRLRKKIRTVIEQKMLSDQRRAPTPADDGFFGKDADIARPLAVHRIEISDEVGAYIGQKVWYNEGAGKQSNLISWNEAERHLSLGIAHFIWYAHGEDGPFTESFPALLSRIERDGGALPQWLRADRDCPWRSRAEVEAARRSGDEKFVQLMRFLEDTVPQQVAFLADRLNDALPAMVAAMEDPAERERVVRNFTRVAKKPDGAPDPDGVYALLDYVNFKGEGTNPAERYQGKGWGLLDVLKHMPADAANPLEAFVDSAKAILQRRIVNAPPGTDDGRWKQGWFKRLETYLPS